MLRKILPSSQPFTADAAFEGRLGRIVDAGMTCKLLLTFELLVAYITLIGFAVRVCHKVRFQVALVGELLVTHGAGKALLLMLLHVSVHILLALETFVTHLAREGHDSLLAVGSRDCIVSCRTRSGQCKVGRIDVVLQVLAKEFDMLCFQLTLAALKCEHVIRWMCGAYSIDQTFTADDTLVIQVSVDCQLVRSVTKFLYGLQAIVEVRALLMFV